MNISQTLRFLLGSTFLIVGLGLPFVARSRSADWNPQQTLIQNVLASHIPLLPDTRKPRFKVLQKGEENRSAYVIQFEETQLFMEFDPSLTTTEIQKAIQSHFPGNHIPVGDPISGRIRFEGWSGHAVVAKPFGWALAASLGFLLAGGLLTSTIWVKLRS